jgi:small GTP-binding protein
MTSRTVLNSLPLPRQMKELRSILNALDLRSLNKEVRTELQTRVAIVGAVNTGKSTLLNYLVGKAVSAVSAVPGTTKTNIKRAVGPFELVDTPGFGDSAQPTRSELAREAIQSADVNLLLLDATAGVRQVDRDLYQELKTKQRPLVTALNKMDLIQARETDTVLSSVEMGLGCSIVPISARTGLNVSERLIPRLIDEQPGLAIALGRALPEYRRMAADKIIRKAATWSLLAGFEPIPGIDIPVLLVAQVRLILRIAALYGEEINTHTARELLATIAGGVVVRYLGEQAAKFLPGPGWALSAGFAAAGTYAIGQVAREYFESGKRIPIEELRNRYASVIAERQKKKS